jgi:hypothetical protein
MRFHIVSFKYPSQIRRIALAIARKPKLRHLAFREVVRNRRLQKEILAALAKHPVAQRLFVTELAKNPQLRREVLKIADNNKRA